MGGSRLDAAVATIDEVIETRRGQGRTVAVKLLEAAKANIQAERELSAAGFQKQVE